MAYDAASGMWKPDPGSSTAEKVTGMLQTSSPYVEQAKSAGMDVANTRGLLNSSIAAGASQKAAYDAVVPIATADASIAAQKDLSAQSYKQNSDIQGQQIASTEKIAREQNTSAQTIAGNSAQKDLTIADMNVASNKQDKASTAAQNYANIYATQVNTINNNKDIPADARATYLTNAKAQYDNSLALVEQMYSVQLDWGATPSAAPSYAPAAPPAGNYSTPSYGIQAGGYTPDPGTETYNGWNPSNGRDPNNPYDTN